jgi:hypothetical protein
VFAPPKSSLEATQVNAKQVPEYTIRRVSALLFWGSTVDTTIELFSVAVNLYHFPFAAAPFDRPHKVVGGVPVSFVKEGAVVVEFIATVTAVLHVPCAIAVAAQNRNNKKDKVFFIKVV